MKKDKSSFSISRREGRSIFLTLLVLGIAFFIFENLSVVTARSWDIRFGYYSVLLTSIVLVVGLLVNLKEIVLRVREHMPSGKSLVALLFLLGFFSFFSMNHIENSHRVLSDETSWESMGLQMYFKNSGGICNEGVWTDGKLDCKVEVNNFKGKTLGFVHSIAYRLGEPNRDTALRVNFPVYLVSLVAFFLALSIWFKSDWLALAATAFLGGMPIYLMQSRSASTEVLYIAILAILMAWYALVPTREVKWKHFLLTVPLLGLFSGTRQETVFAFIPFALYYFRYFRGEFYRLPLFVLSVIVVSWPAVNTMAAYRGYDFQGGTHAAHSIENFIFNFRTDLYTMLNLGSDASHGGILENPFYTTFTVLLLLSTAWLFYRMIVYKRYRRGFVLGFFFCFQIFVILLNVSGTFEIDINQRYVLVALPLFALIMALGIEDVLETYLLDRRRASIVSAAFAILLSIGLAITHTSSFESNMLYYRNKLLGEENFLNTRLKAFPKNSIFIYARPWQMLASGHSSFSERTFMNWTPDDFAKYQNESGGNIYLVRGQDGYGKVNRESRVVGFKTTDQVNSIIDGYRTEKVLVENRLFGYPLSIHRIVSRHGLSIYAQGLSVGNLENGRFGISKNFDETVAYDLFVGDSVISHGVVERAADTVEVSGVLPGLSRFRFEFYVPEDTVRISRDVFTPGQNVRLVSEFRFFESSQDWGNPERNESVEHNALRVGGEAYRYGIGSHANSSIVLDLCSIGECPAGGISGNFRAVVGLDDESACGDGASFALLADGRELWRSKRLYSGDTANVLVPFPVSRLLDLRVERGENMDCDHGDWANAWISDVR